MQATSIEDLQWRLERQQGVWENVSHRHGGCRGSRGCGEMQTRGMEVEESVEVVGECKPQA